MKQAITQRFLFAVSVLIAPEAQAADWPAYNRQISLDSMSIQSNYREYDTSGSIPSGVLDTETGAIPGFELRTRWQGTSGKLPICLQAGLVYARGQTDYQGYLQSGASYTPYKAHTGNTLAALNLRIGLPMASHSDALQWIPYAELASARWQRNLAQYDERYSYQRASLGLVAQWQVAEKWVLEADAALGRFSDANIRAPSLNFSTDLNVHSYRRYGLAVDYKLSKRFSMLAQWRLEKYQTEASSVVNGLQEPASDTRQQHWLLGLTWRY